MISFELHKMSIEELKALNAEVVSILKHKLNRKQAEIALKFNVGDSVVINSRSGRQLVGTITKINQKTIQVDCGINGIYKASPSLLTLNKNNSSVSV